MLITLASENIYCQFKKGAIELIKSTLGKAMSIAHKSDYEVAFKNLPMPYTYYEAMAREAFDLTTKAETEEDKENITAKYVDFTYTCMEKVDGNIVGKYLEGKTFKIVVLIAPPFFFEAKDQITINDILQGKTSKLIRLYKMITLDNKALHSKNCLYIITGYSTNQTIKEEYLKRFKVTISSIV